MEIYSKQKKFKAQTLLNELKILDDKWERRGLNETLLNNIKRFYVPTYPPLPPPPVVCRFDVGRFDVNAFG
ncbi:hypothetical protein ES703_66659 [subsurface metagenome]